MSIKHPIISVIGSSGAGTSTVKFTFDQIFRREGLVAASIEGDAFHRFDRAAMKAEMARRRDAGDRHFSHFSETPTCSPNSKRRCATMAKTGKCQLAHLCPRRQ